MAGAAFLRVNLDSSQNSSAASRPVMQMVRCNSRRASNTSEPSRRHRSEMNRYGSSIRASVLSGLRSRGMAAMMNS